MERPLEQIHQTLQKLVGLHRQLMEIVRVERLALTEANIKGIQEAALAKQGIIEQIRNIESERMKALAELALHWKKPVRDLTLSAIIIEIQGRDPKYADSLRSAYNTLTILIKRVSEQNEENKALVDRSLEHIEQMKKNVLGESVPKTNTYTAKGTRANGAGGARLISKEA